MATTKSNKKICPKNDLSFKSIEQTFKIVPKTSPVKNVKAVKVKQSFLDKRLEKQKIRPQIGEFDELVKSFEDLKISRNNVLIELLNDDFNEKQRNLMDQKSMKFITKLSKHRSLDIGSLKNLLIDSVENNSNVEELNRSCDILLFVKNDTIDTMSSIINFISDYDVQRPSKLRLSQGLIWMPNEELDKIVYLVQNYYLEQLKRSVSPIRIYMIQKIVVELGLLISGFKIAHDMIEKPKYIPQIFGVEPIVPSEIEIGLNEETTSAISEWFVKLCSTINDTTNKLSSSKFVHHIDNDNFEVNHNVQLNLGDGFGHIAELLKPIIPIVALVGVYYAVEKEILSVKAGIGILAVLGVAYFGTVKDYVVEFFRYASNKTQPQGLEDLTDTIMTMFTMHNFRKAYNVGGIASAFRSTKEYSRIKIGVNGFVHDVLTILQQIVDWFSHFIGKERYTFYTGKNPELCLFLDDVNSFLEQRQTDPTINYEIGLKLTVLEKRGNEISKLLSDTIDRQKLSFAMQMLQPWITKKRAGFWYGAGPRVEPMCIFFEGKSQIGKSACMSAMMLDVTARIISEERLERFKENRNSEIYAYNWNRDHQDGYVGQFNCLIDDIGCTQDMAGNEDNVYAALIKMVNSAPYHMNMADLPNKADAFFKSDIIWCTTNRTHWTLNSLYYSEAFVRRIRLGIHVELKDGYDPQDEKVYNKFEHLNFYEIQYDVGGVKNYTVKRNIGGYKELRELIIEMYFKNRKKGEKILSTHDDLINEAIEDRPKYDKWKAQLFMGTSNTPSTNAMLIKNMLATWSLVPLFYYVVANSKLHKKLAFIIEKGVNEVFDGRYPDCSYEYYMGDFSKFLSWSSILRNKWNCGTCVFCNPNIVCIPEGFDEEKFLEYYNLLGLALTRRRSKDISMSKCTEICKAYNVDLDGCDEMFSEGEVLLQEAESIMSRFEDKVNLPYPCGSNTEFVTWLRESFGHKVLLMFVYIYVQQGFMIYQGKTSNYTFAEKIRMKFHEKVPNMGYYRNYCRNIAPLISSVIAIWTLYFGTQYVVGKIFPAPKEKEIYKEVLKESEISKCNNVKCSTNDDGSVVLQVEIAPGVTVVASAEKPRIFMEYFNANYFLHPDSIDKLVLIDDRKGGADEYDLSEFDVSISDKMCIPKLLVFTNQDHVLEPYEIGLETCEAQSVSPVSRSKNERIRPKIILKPQSASGVKTPIRRAEYKPQGVKMKPKKVLKPQEYVFDEANVDIMRKIVLRNQLFMYLPKDKIIPEEYDAYLKDRLKQKHNGILTMIGGEVGIMNGHFYSAIHLLLERGIISQENPVVLVRVNDPQCLPHYWVPTENDFACYEGFGNGDCVGFKLPEYLFPKFSRIVDKFVSHKDMRTGNDIPGSLWTPMRGPVIYPKECKFTPSAFGMTDYLDYNNGNCWMYSIPTKPGDCGSLLTIRDVKSGGSKIVGIHTAGHSNKEGVAFPVFREDVYSIKKGFEDDYFDTLLDEAEIIPQAEYTYQTPFKLISDNNEPPFKSKIQPAPLHDICEPYAIPASIKTIIVDGVKTSPIDLALSKNIPAMVRLNHKAIKLISEQYFKYLIEKDFNQDYERKIQPFDIAVKGKELDKFWRGISRKTSSGYPYKNQVPKGYRGKQHLFGKEGEYDLSTPFAISLRKEIEEEIENLKNNKRTVSYFVDTFKDECLPAHKVAKGKGRLFSAGNIKLLLLNRMYYGDFRAWYLHNRISNDSAIGINVYSQEWDFMYKHLSFGKMDNGIPRWIAIDIAKFDGSMARTWMYHVFDIMITWYNDPTTEKERKILNEHTLNSIHILGNTAYERNGTNSSGGANTADLNTLVNKLYMIYATLLIVSHSKTGVLDMNILEMSHWIDLIFKGVRTEGLGDDLIICVDDKSELYGILTEKELIRAYGLMGITATTDSKDDTRSYDYRYLHEVTFLKRTTVYDSEMGRYVGLLDINSILKSVQWKRDNDPTNHDYKLTLQKALEELSLHPPEIRDKYIDYIIRVGRERVNFVPLSRDPIVLKQYCLARDEIF